MKKLALVLGVLAAMAAPAFAGPIGDTGSFYYGQTGYSYGTGGEFTAYNYIGLTNSDYDAKAKNVAWAPSFQTFCLELHEYTTNPMYFTVASGALNGGVGGSPDPISKGTAYLYSEFAKGTLAGYFTAANRQNEAGLLQAAFWALELETSPAPVGNAYYDLALSNGGTANAAPGELGVYVLNNFSDEGKKNVAQDFLYYRVPDGGTTLMLLGGALMGLGALRRRLGR